MVYDLELHAIAIKWGFLILEFHWEFWRKVDQKDTCNFKKFKSWLERYIQLFFMHACKYLNQKARRIDE